MHHRSARSSPPRHRPRPRTRPTQHLVRRTHARHLAPNAAWIRSPSRLLAPLRAARALTLGTLSAARIATRRAPGPSKLDPAARAALSRAGHTLSVEAIILSHNRWPALEQTVTALLASPAFAPSPHLTSDISHQTSRSITIIDNASHDGTTDRIECFLVPRGINLIKLDTNAGVNAFNIAVARSTADAVLILDDDATPDENSLLAAIDELATRPELGAVTLHPIHPKTGRSEWPFASGKSEVGSRKFQSPTSHFPLPTSHFPIMGCANLIRRSSWNLVRGYEPTFFLYRNDTDLALKLLAAGQGVHFNPALIVWHDSPSGPGQPKSPRWHELATRNWIWMAKRHARGMGLPAHAPVSPSFLIGSLLGYLWSHKLAALSLTRHQATLRGGWSGLTQPAPPVGALTPDGAAWRSLLRLHFRR